MSNQFSGVLTHTQCDYMAMASMCDGYRRLRNTAKEIYVLLHAIERSASSMKHYLKQGIDEAMIVKHGFDECLVVVVERHHTTGKCKAYWASARALLPLQD